MQEHPLNAGQTGFYVVVSDRDLLSKMQDLMKRRGYLGFMDTAGKLNYLVDGRQNMYKAAHTISSINPQPSKEELSDQSTQTQISKRELKKMVITLLDEYGFNKQHKGTSVLQYILPLVFEHKERIAPLSKYVYPLVAQKFGIKAQQVDRLIRYAASASKLQVGNSTLINQLADEMTGRIHESEK